MYAIRSYYETGGQLTAVKGQVTGPFTMLTGISDIDHKLGYYDPTFRDIIVKGIAMKAAWQVVYLKQSFDVPVLLFIDEPRITSYNVCYTKLLRSLVVVDPHSVHVEVAHPGHVLETLEVSLGHRDRVRLGGAGEAA